MTELLNASDEAEALEDLHRRGLTDGLPVIIPTPARVTRMVLASGFDADMVLGTMGPGHGIATIEKVAVAAVMSGCLPDYMPVVLAAVKAVIDPIFDLTEMQATTHCTAPLIIVNGPCKAYLWSYFVWLRRTWARTQSKRLYWSCVEISHDQHRRWPAWDLRYGVARSSGEIHLLLS
jgi:hypothetical protein